MKAKTPCWEADLAEEVGGEGKGNRMGGEKKMKARRVVGQVGGATGWSAR